MASGDRAILAGRINRVTCRLYQGSVPPMGDELRRLGFNVLVLAAEEHQPSSKHFPGLQVIHAPMDDDAIRGLKPVERVIYQRAAEEVVRQLRLGRRVLVTCYAGRNRSGLIVAQALKLLGVTPQASIMAVRQARGQNALSNPRFVDELIHPGRRPPAPGQSLWLP